ncbi:alanyl (membrane) aminopeptidase-like b [Scomber japonicus]|uniref:alanyl (membrane) aminopeptidase-like b n=1 Tax=Scomber japonicus TaxID=13676 RepID=UPI002305A4F2|nr:alanyl (membrane) aminopeptidase-like b [Scomber japonicus]
MPIGSITSMVMAATAVVLTASVIAGTVTMVIIFQVQTEGLNMTPAPTNGPTTAQPKPEMRLPKNLIPEHYEVFIQPHLYSQIIEVVNETSPNQTMLFTGHSTVYFNCVTPTSSIYLHSRDLVVENATVKDTDNNHIINVVGKDHHKDGSDFLQIKLGKSLTKGKNYSLYLDFTGEISENLEALYVSTYTENVTSNEVHSDSMRYLAATNLEPTDARKVFPCFDEPEMKATFDVTVKHRKSMSAIGNAKKKTDNIDGEWETTVFYTTPKMSTYLFAIVVSELDLKCTQHDRVELCMYARPEAIGDTGYAESISLKILKFYEDRFGITYGLNKLAQVALPDLNPGAMENWGLVTYQEAGLLYEEGVSSLLHKEVIATLIAHELAHQWFGNLVTMKWWNQLWLNEGFATYMSYFAVDHVDPTFEVEDMFIMNDLHTAFEDDALASSHALSVPQGDIQKTYEIIEMFDTITYSKGAIVLRMLADVVSQNTFNKGINWYLKAFEFENADQNDLWEYIQKAVYADRGNEEVAEIMDTWTNQVGYPVVTINTTSGAIYQKRFLFNDTATDTESRIAWHIPIRVMTSKNTEFGPDWLTTESATKDGFQSKDGEWILANVNCTGYYRVNYDPDNWQRLLDQLSTNPNMIPVMNRGQLIDDAFNLARAKMVDVPLALNFTQFLYNETAYLPWESAVRNLKYFVLMFDRSEVYGPMQTYLRYQVEGLYNFFSNYTDSSTVPVKHSLQHNQITAIDVACSNGLQACLDMTKRLYHNWMEPNGTNEIHPNLRSVIYCQAVAQGGKKEWEFAWEKFQSSNKTSEKDQLREALSCTKKTWLLNRYLEYTLDPEKIRLMDVASTINYIANNAAGQALAWNFIRAHWDYVSLGDGAMLIEGVTRRFSTRFELEELDLFAKTYDLGPATAAVEQAIEQTRVNIQWVLEHKEIVLDWFETTVNNYNL